MAVGGGVRVEGLNRLVRDLQALGLEVEDLKEAFGEIAAEAAHWASSFAPRRSGNLAASVRGNRAKNKAVVSAGRARVPYAGAVNYGWPARGIAPSSFMQRADEVMRPRALQALDDAIEQKIREKGLG
jgi:hypothetical protein